MRPWLKPWIKKGPSATPSEALLSRKNAMPERSSAQATIWPGPSACIRDQSTALPGMNKSARAEARANPASTGRRQPPCQSQPSSSNSESAASSLSVPAVPRKCSVISPVKMDPAALPAILANCTQPTRVPTLAKSCCTARCTKAKVMPIRKEGGPTTTTAKKIIIASAPPCRRE